MFLVVRQSFVNFVYCDWLQAEGTDAVDQSVYLTAFTLIALHKATKIRDRILQLQVRPHLLVSSLNTSAYLSAKQILKKLLINCPAFRSTRTVLVLP